MLQESHHCELDFVFNHEMDPDYQNTFISLESASLWLDGLDRWLLFYMQKITINSLIVHLTDHYSSLTITWLLFTCRKTK